MPTVVSCVRLHYERMKHLTLSHHSEDNAVIHLVNMRKFHQSKEIFNIGMCNLKCDPESLISSILASDSWYIS